MIVKAKSKKSKTRFCTLRASLTFAKLRQAFRTTPILRLFVLRCHIWIETNISSCAINKIFIQLSLYNFNQWHLVKFLSWKMIPAQPCYKTHNDKWVASVKTFKTGYCDLENCQHKVFVLMDHNNLRRFTNTKSLNSRQICEAQKPSKLYFRIDYY